MANQQKDTSRSGAPPGDTTSPGGDASSGDIPPPVNKGGASAA